MRTFLAALLMVSAAAGQETIPPGVPLSQRQLTTFTAGLLSGEVGYGGAVYGLRVLTPTGWRLISTRADVRPQSQSEDGGCQFCAAAAIAATPTSPEQRSIGAPGPMSDLLAAFRPDCYPG